MPVTTFLHGRTPTRGVLWLGLSATGKVLKREDKSDGAGGTEETYKAGSEIPCRIDEVGGSEAGLADRVSDRTTHIVTLRPGVEVTLNDDFEITGVGRFEITAIRAHTGELARMLEVTDRI